MSYTYSAGIASAYGMAQEAGYGGTYDEWCDLLASLEDFQSISATATTLPEGSSATASYNSGVITFGIPTGATGTPGTDGDDGFSPTATVSKSGSVTTITITDKNGTTTAAVYDGTGSITDITVNGTSVVSGTVAAITVPTKTSDLTNDSGFITSAEAEDINYDNTTSGLTATDVQAAIDELESDKQDALTIDSALSSSSTNPVQNQAIYTALDDAQPILTTIASFSSLPVTVTVSGVTADHVVSQYTVGTPSAQTSDWTITTAADSVTVSGSISGSSTLTLLLVVPKTVTAS